jgi:hypothetical protein
MRLTHFSRLLDIVSGSAFAGARTKVQRSAIYRDFEIAKLNDARFRDIITANLPVFYIVDLDLIAKEIVNGLVSDPKRFISQRFTETGPAAPGEADFSVSDIGSQESKVYQALLNDLIKTGKAELGKFPKKKFGDVYNTVEKLYNKTIEKLSKQNQSYAKYRNAAIKYGFDLRAAMAKEGIFIATDAQQYVALQGNQLLVIGPTFDGVVRKINETLLKPVEDLLESKYSIVVTKNNTGFKIGNLVNAGHTSAVTSSGQIIGVNMPSAQELQFRLSGSPKSFEIDRELGKLYYENNYSITFNQNYSEVGGRLLDMQFAFVISQPAKFNTTYLNIEEQKRLRQVIEGEFIPALEDQIRSKLVGGIIEPETISASPSLVDYIETLVYNSLTGKKTAKLQKSNKTSKKSQLEIPAVFNTNVSKKLVAKSKKAALTKKVTVKTKTVSPQANLLSLQTILDRRLVEQIKQNMGRGERRDILNLRSGRFAESVKVDRMVQSRDGLITAFYSYMKNPYATFSTGGRQELPRSRDPKLLISKSIRQVMQELVANKLRAVSL